MERDTKKKVRVYRGEGKPGKPVADWIKQGQDEAGITEATGRWYTKDKDIANWYVREAGLRGRMVSQDIPEEIANKHIVSKAKRDISRFSRDPANEIFLPKEYVGKGKELTVPEIKSSLLEKAEFGKFQKENQESLATFEKEKRALRVKRKLKEANTRAKQVKVKFKENFPVESDEGLQRLREAKIKVGNQIHPVRTTFRYHKKGKNYPAEINIHGMFSTGPSASDFRTGKSINPVNKTFKPSHLKEAIDIVKKRYPEATQILGERISGIRRLASDFDRTQSIILKGVGKSGKIARMAKKLSGKKLGLLGLGLSLKEAIEAGKATYDAKEGKM